MIIGRPLAARFLADLLLEGTGKPTPSDEVLFPPADDLQNAGLPVLFITAWGIR
jgi:hypothetical protein